MSWGRRRQGRWDGPIPVVPSDLLPSLVTSRHQANWSSIHAWPCSAAPSSWQSTYPCPCPSITLLLVLACAALSGKPVGPGKRGKSSPSRCRVLGSMGRRPCQGAGSPGDFPLFLSWLAKPFLSWPVCSLSSVPTSPFTDYLWACLPVPPQKAACLFPRSTPGVVVISQVPQCPSRPSDVTEGDRCQSWLPDLRSLCWCGYLPSCGSLASILAASSLEEGHQRGRCYHFQESDRGQHLYSSPTDTLSWPQPHASKALGHVQFCVFLVCLLEFCYLSLQVRCFGTTVSPVPCLTAWDTVDAQSVFLNY